MGRKAYSIWKALHLWIKICPIDKWLCGGFEMPLGSRIRFRISVLDFRVPTTVSAYQWHGNMHGNMQSYFCYINFIDAWHDIPSQGTFDYDIFITCCDLVFLHSAMSQNLPFLVSYGNKLDWLDRFLCQIWCRLVDDSGNAWQMFYPILINNKLEKIITMSYICDCYYGVKAVREKYW